MPSVSTVRKVRPWCGKSGNERRKIAAAEPEGGAVEVCFARKLEAERTHVRRARLPQHDRMVIALLDAAQIERFIGLVADQ